MCCVGEGREERSTGSVKTQRRHCLRPLACQRLVVLWHVLSAARRSAR
jgi:hypothetical protein